MSITPAVVLVLFRWIIKQDFFYPSSISFNCPFKIFRIPVPSGLAKVFLLLGHFNSFPYCPKYTQIKTYTIKLIKEKIVKNNIGIRIISKNSSISLRKHPIIPSYFSFYFSSPIYFCSFVFYYGNYSNL